MRIWILVLTCVLVVIMSGCALQNPQPPQVIADRIMGQNASLVPGQSVYVVAAAPGQANVAATAIFGPNVGQEMVVALTPYASRVTFNLSPLTLEPALAAARKENAQYLVIPSLFSAAVLSYQSVPEARLNFFYSVFDVPSGAHLAMREVIVTTGGLGFSIGPAALRQAVDANVITLFKK